MSKEQLDHTHLTLVDDIPKKSTPTLDIVRINNHEPEVKAIEISFLDSATICALMGKYKSVPIVLSPEKTVKIPVNDQLMELSENFGDLMPLQNLDQSKSSNDMDIFHQRLRSIKKFDQLLSSEDADIEIEKYSGDTNKLLHLLDDINKDVLEGQLFEFINKMIERDMSIKQGSSANPYGEWVAPTRLMSNL